MAVTERLPGVEAALLDPARTESGGSNFDYWFTRGREMASGKPVAIEVPDLSIPPLTFANGVKQIRYRDAVGRTITLPYQDERRALFPPVSKARKGQGNNEKEMSEGLEFARVGLVVGSIEPVGLDVEAVGYISTSISEPIQLFEDHSAAGDE